MSTYPSEADDSLVNVHTYSAESLPFGRDLISAEDEAKKAQKNVSCLKHDWADSSYGLITLGRKRLLLLSRTEGVHSRLNILMFTFRLFGILIRSAFLFKYWIPRVNPFPHTNDE